MEHDQASLTARGVAAHRLQFDRVETSYGDPDADTALQEDVSAGLEVQSNMTRYLRVRTMFFDRAVVNAIEAGITQIVAVGAGYDGRSLRYAKNGVHWFELDHPATQADKRARLERLGIAPAGVSFAAADFMVDDVGAALDAAGHLDTLPTLFTCEGVAGYLSPAAVTSVLKALSRRSASESRLFIEIPVVPDSAKEVARRAELRDRLSGLGEPLVSAVPRESLWDYARSTGWSIDQADDPRGTNILQSTLSTAFVAAHVLAD